MEFNRRFFLILVGVVLLGVGAGYLFFGSESPPSTPPNRSLPGDGDQSLSNFSLTENRADDEIWRLFSPKASKKGDTVFLRDPRVVLRVNGDTRAVITADHGTYRLDGRRLILRENVVLERHPQNQTLRTSVLKWDRETGMLETNARVKLRMPQGTLTATGMRAQLRKEIIRFLSDVEFSSR